MSPASVKKSTLLETNQHFYDALWTDSKLVEPERFNTWSKIQQWLPAAPRRLEVGPGLRPRLPIEGSHFVDISPPALNCLKERGGLTQAGSICELPYEDDAFDLVCALDIVEHVDDDDAALAELTRVAAPGAIVLLSTPLYEANWTAFDDLVGHRRRYEPGLLLEKLARHGLSLEQSAAYGMQPKSSKLVDLGMWFMEHKRRQAVWVYNNILMPLGIRNQKPLSFQNGMIDTAGVDEVILVCRR